ncbi:unnamed protein product, partial [Timema podura]|nr:unnamed protein product [Timema podura]
CGTIIVCFVQVMSPLLAMVALWSVLRLGEASCEEARLKCAYRTGCGMALNKYFIGCSAVLHGATSTCPEVCQHALIALTSTEEGQDLMTLCCCDIPGVFAALQGLGRSYKHNSVRMFTP